MGAPVHDGGMQVVARAAQILRRLGQTGGGMTQAQLAADVGLPPSTTNRLLAALEKEQLVCRTGSRGQYRLGPAIQHLAAAGKRDVALHLHSIVVGLSRQLIETVDLGVLEGDAIRFIDQEVGTQPLRVVSAVGEAFPLHVCAPGKAILAEFDDNALAHVLPARLRRNTSASIRSLSALRRELTVVARLGYACDREEHADGIYAVGVALRGPAGSWYALSVPMPKTRFVRNERRVATALLKTRAIAERALA